MSAFTRVFDALWAASSFETLPRLSLRSAGVVPQDEGDHGYCRGSCWRASAITRGTASSFAGAIT